MSENKTRATDASVDAYIAARGSERQRADCRELIALLGKITQQPPRMWGPSIVGFGSYRYTYESGRSGEAPLAGGPSHFLQLGHGGPGVMVRAAERARAEAILAAFEGNEAGEKRDE